MGHPTREKQMTDQTQAAETVALPDGLTERLKRSIAWLERGELLPGNAACIDLDDIKALHILVESLATPPAAAPAPAVPQGWKLVPVEPTPEMKAAGINIEVYSEVSDSIGALTWAEVDAIYRAMLAAAPSQPASTCPEACKSPEKCCNFGCQREPSQEPVTLTEAERVKCLVASGCIGTVKMTYDSGPYEITRTSINASRLIDAIIAALRAKGQV